MIDEAMACALGGHSGLAFTSQTFNNDTERIKLRNYKINVAAH
jgi:hypothetical protein